MRKLATAMITLALSFSILIASPAHATTTYDGTNGNVDCLTNGIDDGGRYLGSGRYITIENNVVTGYNSCGDSIVIPSGVTSIAPYGLAAAGGILDLTIPSTVTSIGSFAFFLCMGLRNVVIPSTVTSIGTGAFAFASRIKSVTLPAGITTIAPQMFSGATSLTSVVIPANVTSIGAQAFYGTTALQSIVIPSNVTSIGAQAFFSASSLQSVDIEGSVVAIEDYTFAGATSLSSITIPASVGTIGNSAFHGTHSLSTIDFLGNAPSVGLDAFAGVAPGAKAHIQSGATGFGPIGSTWNGLIVADTPSFGSTTTVSVSSQKQYTPISLAKKAGVPIVSSKAKVTHSVHHSSKHVCKKSGSKLKTLKAGKCLVIFTVQEPKSKNGKKPKAKKMVRTLVVQ